MYYCVWYHYLIYNRTAIYPKKHISCIYYAVCKGSCSIVHLSYLRTCQIHQCDFCCRSSDFLFWFVTSIFNCHSRNYTILNLRKPLKNKQYLCQTALPPKKSEIMRAMICISINSTQNWSLHTCQTFSQDNLLPSSYNGNLKEIHGAGTLSVQ